MGVRTRLEASFTPSSAACCDAVGSQRYGREPYCGLECEANCLLCCTQVLMPDVQLQTLFQAACREYDRVDGELPSTSLVHFLGCTS
jgi:hypothetical protein|eukprot:SAG25_NODE_543_length_7045_cov_4.651166_7_plen_87_part_00